MIQDNTPKPGPSAAAFSRRKFIAASAGAAMVTGATAFGQSAAGSSRKRYAIVGVGSRSAMYRDALLTTYTESSQLVAFCDNNEGRLKLSQRKAQAAGADVPTFDAKEFDRMIRETKPHVVIVTSKDSTHDTYIIRALQSTANFGMSTAVGLSQSVLGFILVFGSNWVARKWSQRRGEDYSLF